MSAPTLNDFGITQHATIVVTDSDLMRDYLAERGHDHTSDGDEYGAGVLSAAVMDATGKPLLVALDTRHAADPADATLVYASFDRGMRSGLALLDPALLDPALAATHGTLGAAGDRETHPAYPLTVLTPMQQG